jgi:hypothetical protein
MCRLRMGYHLHCNGDRVSGGHEEGKERWDNRPGPNMTAFQSMMLSGSGLPDIPPGGSDDSLLKSRIKRFLQLVD